MPELILPSPKKPIPVIPIYTGGASGALYCIEHDAAYGPEGDYFFPFAVATEEDASGRGKLKRGGQFNVDSVVVPKAEEMKYFQWTNRVLDETMGNLPEDYSINDILILLTGCDNLVKGKRFDGEIGPRVINVHPAPLYVLSGPNGEIVDVKDWSSRRVRERYFPDGVSKDKKWRRRYTGWGEKIMPQILREQHYGASTTHIATGEVDHGPCIAVKHKERRPKHRNRPGLFQDELKDEGDGPTIVSAIHMIRRGLQMEGETLIWEGEPLPYQGLCLEENWNEQMGIKLKD